MLSINEQLSQCIFGTEDRKNCILYIEVLIFFGVFMIFLAIFQRFMNTGTESFEIPFNSEAGFIIRGLNKNGNKNSEPQSSIESTQSSDSPKELNSSSIVQSKQTKKHGAKMDPMEFEDQCDRLLNLLLPQNYRESSVHEDLRGEGLRFRKVGGHSVERKNE